MRPVGIWAELKRLGRDDPKMAAQVTTYLWKCGRIGEVSRGQYVSKGEVLMSDLRSDIAELESMLQKVQGIRTRSCEPKANTNPRYHALSLVITILRKAVDDLRSEG